MALPTRDGGRRGVAVALATTVRWLIVSPMSAKRVNTGAVDRAHRWCLAPDRAHWGHRHRDSPIHRLHTYARTAYHAPAGRAQR